MGLNLSLGNCRMGSECTDTLPAKPNQGLLVDSKSQANEVSVVVNKLYSQAVSVQFLAGAGNIDSVHTVSGAHPATYPKGTGGTFPEVKWPAREADHSLPYSA